MDLSKRLLGLTARSLGRSFESRRGFAVKLAQFLAFDGEVLESELGRFFYDLPPISTVRALDVMASDLGRDPLRVFARIDPEPLAAASVGQVHAATTRDGEDVVIKVQYPFVARAMRTDARRLRQALRWLPHHAMSEELAEEVQERLEEEVDFVGEAERTARFSHGLAIEGVSVPKVYAELSGPRTLTLERMNGDHLDAWLASAPEQALRDRVGDRISTVFWQSFFALREVHADLHPGNLLFDADGRVTVIDFGATKAIDDRLADAVARLIPAVGAGRRAEAFDAARVGGLLGSLDDADAESVFDTAMWPFLEWLAKPVGSAPCDFSAMRGEAAQGRKRFLSIVKENPRPGIYRPLLFLNRTVYLFFSVLERLGARVPMGRIFEEAQATQTLSSR